MDGKEVGGKNGGGKLVCEKRKEGVKQEKNIDGKKRSGQEEEKIGKIGKKRKKRKKDEKDENSKKYEKRKKRKKRKMR